MVIFVKTELTSSQCKEWMQDVCPVALFFSKAQDFALALLEKKSTKNKVSIQLVGFRQVRPLQWKVWRKELLTITQVTLNWLQASTFSV